MANRLESLREKLAKRSLAQANDDVNRRLPPAERSKLDREVTALRREIQGLRAKIEREADQGNALGLPPLQRSDTNPSPGQMFPRVHSKSVKPAPEPEPEPWVKPDIDDDGLGGVTAAVPDEPRDNPPSQSPITRRQSPPRQEPDFQRAPQRVTPSQSPVTRRQANEEPEAPKAAQKPPSNSLKDAQTRAAEHQKCREETKRAQKHYDQASRDGSYTEEEIGALDHDKANTRQKEQAVHKSPEQLREDNALLYKHSQSQQDQIQKMEPEIQTMREELQEANSIIEEQNRRLQTLLDQSTDEQRKAYLAKHPITERDIEQDRQHSASYGY